MVDPLGPLADTTASDEDRILTLPNLVTLVRLCMLPVFVWLLFGADNRFGAGWLLVAIGATDWVDGYLARRLDQVSNVGKILDPVADRLLFFVGVGSILIDGSVPTWVAVAVLVREAAVSIGTLVLAALGAARTDVTFVGKTATFILMGTFPSFLLSHAGRGTDDLFGVLAWATAIPGLALSYYAALLYIPLGRKALAEGRAGIAE